MKVRLSLIAVFFAIVPFMAQATITCDVCGKVFTGKYWYMNDEARGVKHFLCADCEKMEDRCFVCNLPVKEGFQTLADGRLICALDFKEVIQTEEEAKQICSDTHDALDRLLARFMTYPGATNILLSIVNRFYLENLFKAPGEGQACVSIYGATASNHLPGGRLVHSVCIISHLQKARLMAVCAHELTHAWMNDNLTPERRARLDKDTMEAFCELVAYKLMESRQETWQMEIIKKNTYTKGKIDVLLAADARFGFESVVEWIKGGDDPTFDVANVEKVRSVQGAYVSPPTAALATYALPVAARPSPQPTTLVLKSISGTSQHRFALINNTTFEAWEKGRVRLGQTNVIVQCLEIHNDSVLIQVDGSTEKRQLFLKSEQ